MYLVYIMDQIHQSFDESNFFLIITTAGSDMSINYERNALVKPESIIILIVIDYSYVNSLKLFNIKKKDRTN
jgi:hypothetical protein